MTDPLTTDQRQRLAALNATWDALHVGEIDVWDLIRCAHWVWNGDTDPIRAIKDPFERSTEPSFGSDEATWGPNERVPTVHPLDP